MAERPNGFPSDEEIHDAYDADADVGEGEYPHIEALIACALEEAVEIAVRNLNDDFNVERERHAVALRRARLEAKIEALDEVSTTAEQLSDLGLGLAYLELSPMLSERRADLRAALAALEEKS